MKYLAIEFAGKTEVTGFRYVYDDLKKESFVKEYYFNHEDTTKVAREFSKSLEDLGLPVKGDGRIVVDVAFAVFDLSLLQHLTSINQRVQMTLYNPLILYCDGTVIPMLRDLTKEEGVYGIITIVRRYFNR